MDTIRLSTALGQRMLLTAPVLLTGGPAIGDVRSRLIRLSHPRSSEDEAVIRLLGYRLTAQSREAAGQGDPREVEGEGPNGCLKAALEMTSITSIEARVEECCLPHLQHHLYHDYSERASSSSYFFLLLL